MLRCALVLRLLVDAVLLSLSAVAGVIAGAGVAASVVAAVVVAGALRCC